MANLISRFLLQSRRLPLIAALAFALVRPAAGASPWIDVYYPYWEQKNLPIQNIPLRGVTDVIYFALQPQPDGSLDSSHLTEVSEIVAAAHAAHAKAIISVGGAGTVDGFRGATLPGNVVAFVANIVSYAASNGFDGIDIDFEPLEQPDAANFRVFSNNIRAALDLSGNKLQLFLTPVPGTDPSVVSPVMDDFNQINLQSYRLSGPYPGWVTWHDAALYNDGKTFPDGKPLPCASDLVDRWVAAGFPAKRLGIGISCWGLDWNGANAPEQPIDGVTAKPVAYSRIMSDLYSAQSYHYDPGVKAAWLGLSNDFVSYEDAVTCRDKVAYLRDKKLGGLIVWDIAGGYTPDQPEPMPLLNAIISGLH